MVSLNDFDPIRHPVEALDEVLEGVGVVAAGSPVSGVLSPGLRVLGSAPTARNRRTVRR